MAISNTRADDSASLWRNRKYLCFWLGQVSSYIGNRITEFAFLLFVLDVTRSPAQTGLMAGLSSLTYTLFGLLPGVEAVIAGWNSKRVIVLSNLARALCIASIPIAVALDSLTTVHIYLVVLVTGILTTLFDTAKPSLLPQIVSKQQIAGTTVINQATIGIGALIGPLIAGALYLIWPQLPFLLAAAAFLIAAGVFALLQDARPVAPTPETPQSSAALSAALRWIVQHPLMAFMVLVSFGDILLTSGYPLIVIVMAQPQASPLAIAVIFTVGGLAGLLGAAVSGRVQRRFSFPQVILATMWLFALLWLPLLVNGSLLMLSLVMALFFFLSPLFNVVYVGYRRALAPEHLRSEVGSVARLLSHAALPFSWVLTGLLLEQTGPQITVAVCAAGLALLAVAATINPYVRKAQPLDQLPSQTGSAK